jgi:hypothetical protein
MNEMDKWPSHGRPLTFTVVVDFLSLITGGIFNQDSNQVQDFQFAKKAVAKLDVGLRKCGTKVQVWNPFLR